VFGESLKPPASNEETREKPYFHRQQQRPSHPSRPGMSSREHREEKKPLQ